MKLLYVVLEEQINDRQVILITSSYNKAMKVAEKLQEQNNPNLNNDDSNGVVYEVQKYSGFKNLESYYFN